MWKKGIKEVSLQMTRFKLALAILCLALGLFGCGRYQVTSAHADMYARLDTWTGELCLYEDLDGWRECSKPSQR